MKELNIRYRTKEVRLLFGKGAFSGSLFSKGRRHLVLTDDNVYKYHGEKMREIPGAVFKCVPAGEESKTVENVLALFELLLEEGFTKDDCLVAFGGGMVTDLGGFVASTFKRGMRFASVPTSLLAQVDTCLGGKTGVDFPSGGVIYKNQIGTVYHPELVIVDPLFLDTLPEEEIRSGLGEILKYALCFDAEMFARLGKDFAEEDILTCLSLKAEITVRDEFEEDERVLLNYGHTIGHALESLSGFALRHGEAVALGLYHETRDPKIRERIKSFLDKHSFPDFPFKKEELIAFIKQDKKLRGRKLKLPVLREVGRAEIVRTDIDAYLEGIL